MATLPTFSVPVPLTNLSIAPAIDLVFRHRGADGNYDFGFNLTYCLKSVALTCEEISVKDEHDRAEGQSVFRITGEIGVLQNSLSALNSIALHGGRLFELHVLYKDGTAESFPPRVAGSSFDAAVQARYPYYKTVQDQLGFKLAIKGTRGGESRNAKIAVEGITFGSSLWKPKSVQAFYDALTVPTQNNSIT